MTKHLKITLSLLFLGFSVAQAQLTITPNMTPYPKKVVKKSAAKNTAQAPLDLPFFDDFSTLVRDPNKWVDSGGVFVNNEFGFEPISKGVATFDGFNEQGEPYDFSTVVSQAIGPADRLISCPIDLSGGPNSTFLAFYWQLEGFGEIPDSEDTLQVQLKDSTDTWQTVWTQIGGNPIDTVIRRDTAGMIIDTVVISRLDSNFSFIQEFIPIEDLSFFHDDFQFRFIASGRLSGLYDVWNVDYVVLNNNINPAAFFPNEIAVSKQPNFFLKRYAAMPVNQYFANPGIETADVISTTINNFSSSPDGPAYSVILEDTNSNTLITRLLDDSGLIPIDGQARNFVFDVSVPDDVLPFTEDFLALKTTFIVSTGDSDTGTPTLPNIDLRVNDTISSITTLSDYYAYDDGTAEFGAGINQRFGQVAVRFETNILDTITDVQIHLTKFERDLVGQTYTLFIWQNIDTPEGDSVLFSTSVPIRYPDQRNGFETISSLKQISDPTFEFPNIPVNGVFYVGWRQTTNDRLTVGYDRNNDATSQIFFNEGQGWESFEVDPEDPIRQKERGSLMIRPVFGQTGIVSSIGEEIPEIDVRIFPNPASQEIFFDGELPERVEILDLHGKVLLHKKFSGVARSGSLGINQLVPAIYVIKAYYPSNNGITQILTKRMVIVR